MTPREAGVGGRTIKLLGIQAGKGGRTPGAERGPAELRRRGLVKRLESGGHHVEDLGDIPGVYETRYLIDRAQSLNYLANIVQVNRHTHACVLGTRRKSPTAFLLCIGGDHSLAIGTLAGLSDACKRLGLVWIDAHADLNTPGSSPSGNIHGMSLAVACGHGHIDLRRIAELDPMVREADVLLAGCRDLDPGERAAIARDKLWMRTTDDLRAGGAAILTDPIAELARRCDHIHLSFDIDVLEPVAVPGTGTPVPGGLSADEAITLLRALGRQRLIHSAEFVEYNARLDEHGKTADLTIALIEALLSPETPDPPAAG